MAYQYSSTENLAEEGGEFGSSQTFAFSEKSIRLETWSEADSDEEDTSDEECVEKLRFIRKVYGILLCQLTVTIVFIVLFLFVEPIKMFSYNNPWLWGTAFALTFVCLIALACCPDVRRSFPTNLIFLGVFTVCESFLLGAVASCYESNEVLMAVGITAAVALGLTIFAMQTKWDFTMCSGGLLVLLIILLFFGILCAFIPSHILRIFYASLGALVFSLYLVFDTQMMLGGKHQYALSPEEYIFAALNLYLDVVNLFLFILSLIGSARGN